MPQAQRPDDPNQVDDDPNQVDPVTDDDDVDDDDDPSKVELVTTENQFRRDAGSTACLSGPPARAWRVRDRSDS